MNMHMMMEEKKPSPPAKSIGESKSETKSPRGSLGRKVARPARVSIEEKPQAKEHHRHGGVEGTAYKLSPAYTIPSQAAAGQKNEVFNLKYSPDGTHLAAARSDGSVNVYNSFNGNEFALLPAGGPNRSLPYMSVRWRPTTGSSTTNILLAVNVDGSIEHWHVNSKKRINLIEEDSEVYCCDFSPDGSAFATGGQDTTVKLWDEQSREAVASLRANRSHVPGGGGEQAGHGNRIFAVKYHPDNENVLLSGAWDRTVQVWDLRSGRAERTIFGPLLTGDALDVQGDRVLTGAFRNRDPLELWDLGSARLVQSVPWFQGHGEESCRLMCARFSSGESAGLVAAGGCGVNEARVFDRDRGLDRVARLAFPSGVYSLDFQPNGLRLAVGTEDGSIVVLNVEGNQNKGEVPMSPFSP